MNYKAIRKKIYEWNEKNDYHTNYAWRSKHTSDFHGLVAEICLQRTTATAVQKVYDKLIADFKTPYDFIKQNRRRKLKRILRPLGIISRADSLIALSRKLISDFDGKMPETLDELLLLPGVGPYIASSFLVIHKNKKCAMIDGNITRFLSRYYGIRIKYNDAEKIILSMMGRASPRKLNLAILDFCMKVCRHGKYPKCMECPLSRKCSSKVNLQ